MNVKRSRLRARQIARLRNTHVMSIPRYTRPDEPSAAEFAYASIVNNMADVEYVPMRPVMRSLARAKNRAIASIKHRAIALDEPGSSLGNDVQGEADGPRCKLCKSLKSNDFPSLSTTLDAPV